MTKMLVKLTAATKKKLATKKQTVVLLTAKQNKDEVLLTAGGPTKTRRYRNLTGHAARRPPQPFSFFVKRHALGKGHSRDEHRDHLRQLGEKWRSLSATDKEEFESAVQAWKDSRTDFHPPKQEKEERHEAKHAQEEEGRNNDDNEAADKKKQITLGDRFTVVGDHLIGSGSYGSVATVVERNSGRLFAAKIFLHAGVMEDTAEESDFDRELSVYSQLQERPHPSFLTLVYQGDGLLRHMVMPLCESVKKSLVGTQNHSHLASYALQIAAGLHHLHSVIGYRHGDVKPSNTLWEPSSRRAFLCDFGTTLPLDTARRDADYSCGCGTVPFRAPELWPKQKIVKTDKNEPAVSFANDRWALGCTLFYVYTGKYLFRVAPPRDVYEEITAFVARRVRCPRSGDALLMVPLVLRSAVWFLTAPQPRDRLPLTGDRGWIKLKNLVRDGFVRSA